MAMDSGNYAPTGASYGEFTIMQMSGTPTAKASSFQKEDFVAKYALSNRTLTARELAMVPTLPDWYIIPKEVVRVCEHAKVTTASSQPMRNFLFRARLVPARPWAHRQSQQGSICLHAYDLQRQHGDHRPGWTVYS